MRGEIEDWRRERQETGRARNQLQYYCINEVRADYDLNAMAEEIYRAENRLRNTQNVKSILYDLGTGQLEGVVTDFLKLTFLFSFNQINYPLQKEWEHDGGERGRVANYQSQIKAGTHSSGSNLNGQSYSIKQKVHNLIYKKNDRNN